jgi:hypothetical protein
MRVEDLEQMKRVFGTFSIDAFSPETISMSRLADYMAALSKFLGSTGSVHFDRIDEGSLQLVYWTEPEAVSEIRQRQVAIETGTADEPLRNAYEKVNDLLEEDTASAILEHDSNVVDFPGAKRPTCPAFGPFWEDTSLDGQLIRIGGKDTSIHALLVGGGAVLKCEMNRRLAVEMCHHLFGAEIRVYGRARWERSPRGTWTMLKFVAESFEELDSRTLLETVDDLRTVKGSGWSTIDDPIRELALLRGD